MSLFKFYFPSVLSLGLAALLVNHPVVCTSIVVGGLLVFGIAHSLKTTEIVQSLLQKALLQPHESQLNMGHRRQQVILQQIQSTPFKNNLHHTQVKLLAEEKTLDAIPVLKK